VADGIERGRPFARARVSMDYLMDDLLKVFLGETTECMTACWAAVERLRRMPGDSAALGDLLHQVRSVQETSKFLGMSSLQASAGLVLESLESASARRPASTDRIVPIAVDGLLRIEAVINAMANAEGEPAPHAAPASRFGNPVPAANPVPPAAIAAVVENIDSALTDGLPPVPTPAPDGTVRINAETLGYLVSTVRGLVAAQAEMMRLLQAKEAERAAAAAAAPAPDKKKAREPIKSASCADAPKTAEPTPSLPAAHAPASGRPAQLLGAASPGMIRVLLFRGADGGQKAAYLDQVAGLEEVDLKAVDHSRGLWIMRSGSDLLPLVAVDPAGTMPSGGRAPVIVFTVDRQSFGLLVDAIPEVADVMPRDPASHERDGVVLLNGKAIEVIDPARYLDHAIRARVERRRPDRKRRTASDEHAPAPPARDDLFVRKPAR
jgi:hypothetical protein